MTGEGARSAQDVAIDVLSRLRVRGESLAVAESCTGGGLGAILTSIPGASAAFVGGVIAYSDSVKVSLLGVAPATLTSHGAVSRESSLEMADGVREILAADWGVSITGIAGPDGGSRAKPVGTVFIGLSGPDLEFGERFRFPGEREEVRTAAAWAALDLLARSVKRTDV
ncbi:MAG: CinA family protein [marine benthic group bacterium]|nr:CinA family protein [Gemmatimonadota bacterium]MCL7978466.1 CinA family protein [Gemmatimonadota bacterium]